MVKLTSDRLRAILNYDPETGRFARLVSRGGSAPGDRVGTMCRGYLRIMVDGRSYPAHRLAWLFMLGEWPQNDIDHINGDKVDNRFSNLREATASQNLFNRGPQINNSSGLKGVYTVTNGRTWYSRIKAGSTSKYLGTFQTAQAAHAAYCAAADALHGRFARAS